MQISISNAIESLRRGGARIIQFGLQLWLDFTKSEVIGSEEVVNGDFATDLSGWTLESTNATNTITWNNGRVEMIADGSTQLNLSQDVFEVGKTYKIELDAYNVTGAGFKAFDSGLMFTIQSDKHYEFYHTALSTSLKIYRNTSGSSSSGELDNISVKEFPQFVKDKSPNTNNATLFTGKALSFDGGNDYVDCGDVGANKTLAFWFNSATGITSGSGAQRLFGFNTNYHSVSLGSVAGDLTGETLTILPDASSRTATTMNFQAGVWYRVVVIWNATNSYYDIYVNGELKTDLVFGTHTLIDWSNFLMGEVPVGTGGNFEGELSDVQIYNKVWTEPDVAFDYNNPNHLAIDNPDTDLVVTDLKAYWALSEGDGLVAYDSGSTLEEDLIQNGDFSELGSELITNGDFATDLSGWTLFGVDATNTITWEPDGARIISTTENISIAQNNVLTVGSTYKLTCDVNITYGKIGLDSATAGVTVNMVEGFNEIIFTAINTRFKIKRVDSITNCLLDNVSVKQVDPNDEWTLDAGWSYGNNKADSSGGSLNMHQSIASGSTLGGTYQVSMLVSDYVSGYFSVAIGGYDYDSTIINDNGIQTRTVKVINASANDRVYFDATSFVGSVTNISVKEITPSDHGGIINGATYTPAQDTIPQLGMMDWAKGSNLYLSSEPTANESAAGNISYGSYSWGLNGFSNATIFGDNSVLRYRYGGSTTIGVEYTLSAFVIMDDNSEPDVTNLSSSGDFSLVVSGSVGVGVISKTNISGNIWRVSKVKTAVDSTTSNGIVKYTTQSAKGFKVVGWQIEESSSVGNYILTDGAAAIDVTTIQNPTNKGYDILGNALRLREHAFNLDGSGYAEVADSDSLDFGTGDFTVECWATYKFENTGSGLNVIISNGLASSASTLGFNLLTNSGDFVIRLGDGSNVYTKSIAGAPIESTWYYIAFTRVGTTLTVYLDDVDGVDYTDADIAVDVTTDNPITVGVDAQSTRKYKGLIDDTRLYNRALTQKEITNNYIVGLKTHTNPSSYSDDYSSDYGF